jgi:hypothetical protein
VIGVVCRSKNEAGHSLTCETETEPCRLGFGLGLKKRAASVHGVCRVDGGIIKMGAGDRKNECGVGILAPES